MAERKPPTMGPGRRVVYRPDHKSFGEFILSDQMRDVVEDVCSDIARAAAGFTPVGPGDDGHMRDKYKVVRNAGTMKVDRAHRVQVNVVNDDPASALVEFGGRRMRQPGRRMLARAGALFGDFKGGKKGNR